ncbi:hypothetical protein RF683_07050 [Flavobacterium sp. 20NA77.7]|uniref:DUF1761 domain-containing protein n=1 Tax=Flavobacterium nakdongensis TaxID=3073563 RepID=A0ABY9R8G5_9FLAO|nr:hypothetical protein [Flavobacterium sp. 20NA77.7]WMW77251.1 hypothetical protein RF683_07050 [Flavobacterium sp. 20NA77.7]
MNTKNFIIGGIAGGIINFFLGWIFYGMLFKDLYPQTGNENLLFVFLGCLTFGFLVSQITINWAQAIDFSSGLKVGIIVGLLYSLSMNFFMYSSMQVNYENMAIDVIINIISTGLIGATIAAINGKLK